MNNAMPHGREPTGVPFVRSLVADRQSPPHDIEQAAGSVLIVCGADAVELLGIEDALRGDPWEIRAASDIERVVALCEADDPVCVVRVCDDADRGVLAWIRELREHACDRPLIVRCERADAETVIEAVGELRATFLIGREALGRLRAQAAAAIAQDRDSMRRAILAKRARSSVAKLTDREHEVFSLMLRGCANKQIAAELGVSVKTVETHRSRVLHKLGVDNVAEFAHLLLTLLT